MRIKRKSKPVVFSAKLIIFYIVIIFIVLMIYKNFVGPLGNREIKLVKQIKQTPGDYNKIFVLGDYYYSQDKFEDAIYRYRMGLAISDNQLYNYKLGLCYLKINRPESIEYIKRSMELGYMAPDSHINLAYAYKLAGDAFYESYANKRYGESSSKSLVLLIKKNYVNFIESYKIANRDEPKLVYDVIKNLENVDPENKNIYIKLLENKELSPIEQYRLALVYKDTGNYEKAEKLFESANSKLEDPSLKGKILYNLGWLKFENKRYSQALEYYKKARKYWNSTRVNYWIAKTYYVMGDHENAMKFINSALKMDPKYYDALDLKEKIK